MPACWAWPGWTCVLPFFVKKEREEEKEKDRVLGFQTWIQIYWIKRNKSPRVRQKDFGNFEK